MNPTASRPVLLLHAADGIVEAAERKAMEIGVPMAIAVVDAAATLMLFRRMEGASMLAVSVTLDKAHTAAVSGFDTQGFFDHVQGHPQLLAGLPARPGLSLLGGGIPLRADGQIVGAIGVGGGHYTQDVEVAAAGAAAYDAMLAGA